MGCETCGDKKPACDKGFTKATLEIKNPSQLVEFRKIVVPASLGDDTAVPPVVGKYCNAILYYEANDQVYLYSSDGIPTKITVDVEALKKQIKDLQEGLASEVETRSAADLEIWQEIETIEASSDVVDVVGTYAELQQYDTSKLHDKDLIKVLADETHDDAITYYRWSTSSSSFSYVGAEGPYYTVSETDTLLSAKQDTLVAGTNIQIASDGVTISATDTTYTHFTGATASTDGVQGLVPGPLAGDQNKVLKGDGTWGDAATSKIFYINESLHANRTTTIYKDAGWTTPATASEVYEATLNGPVYLNANGYQGQNTYGFNHLIVYSQKNIEDSVYFIFHVIDTATNDSPAPIFDTPTIYEFNMSSENATSCTPICIAAQKRLSAGANITITGSTISATDTTYTAGDGIDITSNTIKSTNTGTLTFDTPSAGYFTIAKDAIDYYTAAEIYDIVNTKKQSLLITFSNNNVSARVIGSTPIVNNYYTVYALAETTLYELVYDMTNPQSTTSGTYDEANLKESVMTGASAGAAGAKGLVPAPAMGQQNSFLRGDGTWQTITVPVLYTTQGQNEDGAVTQKLFTDTVGNIEAALQILNSGAGVP
jgi:hypothetical protein